MSELDIKADPELLKQLDQASASGEQVVAVVRLNSDDPSQIVPPPEKTERIVQQVLNRVKKRVSKSSEKHNVFENLGYFVVAADSSFLRELILQPEIARAIANHRPDSALIPPVKKRPVPPVKRKQTSAKHNQTASSAKKAKSTSARKASK